MRSPIRSAVLVPAVLVTLFGTATRAHAIADPGTIAPEFVKNEVVSGATGPAWSLNAHAGKVILLFVMGYN